MTTAVLQFHIAVNLFKNDCVFTVVFAVMRLVIVGEQRINITTQLYCDQGIDYACQTPLKTCSCFTLALQALEILALSAKKL